MEDGDSRNVDPYSCMRELKRNILTTGDKGKPNPNPRFWFGDSGSRCMQSLNRLIIGALRHNYLDFTDGMTQKDRDELTADNPRVGKLSEGFMNMLREDDGLEKATSMQEKWLDIERKAGLDDPEQEKLLWKIIRMAHHPETSAEITSEDIESVKSIGLEKLRESQAFQRFAAIQNEQDCQCFYRPIPYIGYFVNGLLTDSKERGGRGAAGSVEMMSEKEYWQTRDLPGMWKAMEDRFRAEGYEEGLPDDDEFRRRLSGVVRKYLDRTYMQVAATGKLKETVRGRLRRGRVENGEFIYVRDGCDHDEQIEQIREFLRTRTDQKKKWKPDGTAARRGKGADRLASWGNYLPGPARVSACMASKALLEQLFRKKEFEDAVLELRQPTTRSKRRGMIGPRHQLEDFLHTLFRLADGTMYMRGIIEAILRKLPQLGMEKGTAAESRTGKVGNTTLEGIDYEQRY